LGAEIELAAAGAYSAYGFTYTVGAGTKVFSTMYRGFENILKGRDPRDAIQITQRICGVCPVPHGITSTFAVENAMGYSDEAGDNTGHSSGPNEVSRLVRNLILGGEFMMSAITHFYALTALDLVQGPGMAPWTPFWHDSYYDPLLRDDYAISYNASGNPANIRTAVITDYVLALRTRTKAINIGAIFGGRLPIASSFVAGGVTKVPTTADVTNANTILTDVKSFISNNYIPMTEIVTALHGLADNTNNDWQTPLVSLGLQSAASGDNQRGPYSCRQELPNGLGLGRGCGNFYSAGGFDGAGDMDGGNNSARLFPRGVVTGATDAASGTLAAVDPTLIKESIKYARYEQGTGDANEDLWPLDGVTYPEPDKTAAYTWHKAPRYDDTVVEVGPLARMWVKGAAGSASGYCAGQTKTMTSHAFSGSGMPLPALGGLTYDCGISVMDRHRARAREALVIANSMEGWLTALNAIVSTSNWQATNPRYTDAPDPLEGLTATGFGMGEAPRGSVHHWVKIKDGKIDNYQIQAPTTWNCSGRDSDDNPGPVEQALIGWPVLGTLSPNGIGAGTALVPVEALIIVHSFDPCIACSIHVIDPKEGTDMKGLKVNKGGVE
jgi:hydrogenase large subunit